MSRFRTIALIILLFVGAAELAAQQKKSKPKNTLTVTPPVTTITSFDKDHTVIGWMEIIPFESKIYHSTRTLRVLVPANYFSPHNTHRSYPVLYMQDGQNLFDKVTSNSGEWQMDETVEHLVGGFRIPPMFVVGIDNGGEKRSSEYLPYPDSHNDKDGVTDEKDVHGKEYARFVVTEVMPFIEKRYRIARGTMNAGLGGSSYGGDIALYTALQYPGTFGHLLIESPPLWIGNEQLMKDVQKAKVLPQKIYLGIGNDEDPSDPKISEEAVKLVQELESELRKKGLGPARLKLVVDEGGMHNEEYWSKRLPDAMLFLYSSDGVPPAKAGSGK
jgi:predicted alpha/beta superfamily hydrolase